MSNYNFRKLLLLSSALVTLPLAGCNKKANDDSSDEPVSDALPFTREETQNHVHELGLGGVGYQFLYLKDGRRILQSIAMNKDHARVSIGAYLFDLDRNYSPAPLLEVSYIDPNDPHELQRIEEYYMENAIELYYSMFDQKAFPLFYPYVFLEENEGATIHRIRELTYQYDLLSESAIEYRVDVSSSLHYLCTVQVSTGVTLKCVSSPTTDFSDSSNATTMFEMIDIEFGEDIS